MTKPEFKEFKKQSMINYANDKIQANGLTRKEAEKVAEEDFKRFLPGGFSSKNNFLFILVDSNEKSIGHLWYLIRGSDNNQKAFIADIFLNENSRGKGYGRQAMTLLEEHVSSQKINRIGLHVFGFNEAAIHLYKSLNYITTDLVMEKTLS